MKQFIIESAISTMLRPDLTRELGITRTESSEYSGFNTPGFSNEHLEIGVG